jgi:pSer/pThr/pTyr-binding forkhead associated (FHA) protein
MIYRLIILTGPLSGQRITLATEPMTVGRDESCEICIPDEEAARRHAVIEHKTEGLFIRDLGSMNKILVNKLEIHDAKLRHGDTIEIGRTRFLVQAILQAEVDGEAPAEEVEERRRPRGALVAALLVLAAAAVYIAIKWPGRASAQHGAVSPPEPSAAAGPTNAAAPPEPAIEPAPPMVEVTSVITQTSPEVSLEIRQMKEEVAALRDTLIEGLARTATPPVAVVAPEPAPPPPEPLDNKPESLLERARQEIAMSNYNAADQMLDSLQSVYPTFVPAFVERARLYEERGLPDRALAQWTAVLLRSEDPSMHQQALDERTRLTRVLQTREASTRPMIRISSVEQARFRSSDDYDDMRTLHIGLAAVQPEEALEKDAIRVEVTFYDIDRTSGAVAPTRAIAPSAPIALGGAWNSGKINVVDASYVIPKGFRQREVEAGHDPQYWGYLVKVSYYGELQDKQAVPKSILELQPPAAAPAAPAADTAAAP